jgi:hypothetical protein
MNDFVNEILGTEPKKNLFAQRLIWLVSGQLAGELPSNVATLRGVAWELDHMATELQEVIDNESN